MDSTVKTKVWALPTRPFHDLVRKRRSLIWPWVDGHNALPGDTSASRDGWPQRGLAAAVMAVCGGAVALMVKLAG